jgi:hypothetical protein
MKQAMEKNAVNGTEGLAGVYIGKWWGAARDSPPSAVLEKNISPHNGGLLRWVLCYCKNVTKISQGLWCGSVGGETETFCLLWMADLTSGRTNGWDGRRNGTGRGRLQSRKLRAWQDLNFWSSQNQRWRFYSLCYYMKGCSWNYPAYSHPRNNTLCQCLLLAGYGMQIGRTIEYMEF